MFGSSKVTSKPTPQSINTLMQNGILEPLCHVTETYVTIPFTLRPKVNGPHNGLPLIGCFGPFPSQLTTNNVAQTFRAEGSNGKRRRVVRMEHENAIPNITPIANLIESDPLPHTVPLPESPPAPNPNNHLDLNTPPIHQNENTEARMGSPQISEIEKTAELGLELGFNIEPNNPILREAMGEGEIAPPPMNCLSLNMRGTGETHKVNWVK